MSYEKLTSIINEMKTSKEVAEFIVFLVFRNSEKISEMYYPSLLEYLETDS